MSSSPGSGLSALGGLFVEALRLDRWTGDKVRARAQAALELQVAGFLLFGGEAGEVSRLTAWLRGEAGRPLLIASDMEKGVGQQVRGGAHVPPPAGLAAHPHPEESVAAAARLTAREARELGINWILAPVLDLDMEPRNPIVGTRSFGSDPETVARLGKTWVDACQSEGVAACAKHFPGHGRTVEDSHVELPTVPAPRETLKADLLPFRRVAGSVAAMMTAHVAYPAFGGHGPATLSEAILRDLLRAELGFQGLVVSDALVMAGFQAPDKDRVRRSEGSLVVRAVAAGCDLLLYPRDVATAVLALETAVQEDSAVADAATAAMRRVENVAHVFDATGRGPAESSTGGHEAMTLRLAVETLSVPDPVPEFARKRPTEILWSGQEPEPGAGTAPGCVFATELTSLGWHVVSVEGLDSVAASGGKAERDTSGGGEEAVAQRIVLVYWTPRAWRGRGELASEAVGAIRKALLDVRRAWVIVLGHPRILAQIGSPGLCAWSDESLMERAAARWLDAHAKESAL